MRNHVLVALSASLSVLFASVECYYSGRMPKGFRVFPQAGGDENIRWRGFHPALLSPNGNFAMGFSKVDRNNHFLLTIVCVTQYENGEENGTEIVWTANRNNYVNMDSELVQASDGSLALQDERGRRHVWGTDAAGENAALFLLDSGNLQLKDQKRIEWQSFDHPTDTLLQGQNLSASMKLISAASALDLSEGPYSLEMEVTSMVLSWRSEQVYWRRVAMQEKALILTGKGRIYARLEPGGYLAMYQTESALVDMFPLDTYRQNVSLRRLKMESDGNLRSYYWRPPRWEIDFEAVQSSCELPSFCGAYGVCTAGNPNPNCNPLCVGKFMPAPFQNGSAATLGCPPGGSSLNFCREWKGGVARIPGMDFPYRQFARFLSVASETECQELCVDNCSCAAAFYHNYSNRCYQVPAPLEMTLVQVGTQEKVALLKLIQVKKEHERDSSLHSRVLWTILVLFSTAIGAVAVVVCGFVLFIKISKRRCADKDNVIEMSQKFIGGLPGRSLP